MKSTLTFHDLAKTFGLDPREIRLVRHGNKEMKDVREKDVLDVFQHNEKKFTQYSAWQMENKFGDAKFLAMFSPARGTTSLFLGIWSVNGVTKNSALKPEHLEMLRNHELPEKWYRTAVYYHLALTKHMCELSERLIIEWGRSTLSWVQLGDKDVVQVKAKNSIGDFISYDSIRLNYADIQKLFRDSDSNVSWINALSSVKGIYLIKHKIDGKLYVGSAYGEGGILGRWKDYATRGHGGNAMLISLDPKNFEFSVLEISTFTMSQEEIVSRENRWKECLGTRKFGLNESES